MGFSLAIPRLRGRRKFVLSRMPMPAQAGICSVTALPFRAGGLCKRSIINFSDTNLWKEIYRLRKDDEVSRHPSESEMVSRPSDRLRVVRRTPLPPGSHTPRAG